MMKFLTAVVSCAIVASTMAAAISQAQDQKEKCHGLDCPNYTVLNKTESWELRQYAETKWVSTNGTGIDRDSVNSMMFHLLFDYISGKNEKNVKIPMTAPVLTQVNHGPGPTCESSFTMHFMLPFNQWNAPVAPTDQKVFISTTPKFNVFVRSFGGFAKDQDYVDNLMLLSEDVKAIAKVHESYFFTAGYDGPYTFRDRHNEVWLAQVM